MSAVVPRLSFAECSAVRWVGMVVLCCTGLCGVVLWMLRIMVPYTEVLMFEGDCEHSNEQELRLVFSFLGGFWPGRRAAGRRLGEK